MWEVIRWTVFWLLGGLSLLFIVGNWCLFIGHILESSRIEERRSLSFAPPFLSGIVGVVACLVSPSPMMWGWWWLPPLLDPSISLILICFVLHGIARAIGRPSPFDWPETDEQPDEDSPPG